MTTLSKANNGGYDSRFVTETGSGNAHWYVSSTELRDYRAGVFGVDFAVGDVGYGRKGSNAWSLRSFVAELPQP